MRTRWSAESIPSAWTSEIGEEAADDVVERLRRDAREASA
jgi:hypothetical protein